MVPKLEQEREVPDSAGYGGLGSSPESKYNHVGFFKRRSEEETTMSVSQALCILSIK